MIKRLKIGQNITPHLNHIVKRKAKCGNFYCKVVNQRLILFEIKSDAQRIL